VDADLHDWGGLTATQSRSTVIRHIEFEVTAVDRAEAARPTLPDTLLSHRIAATHNNLARPKKEDKLPKKRRQNQSKGRILLP
jgi:hypothetical protein